MTKTIMIDKKTYTLELKDGKMGSSGTVYHLKTDSEDLAVKIFHKRSINNIIEKWYPNIKELNYFIKNRNLVYPVILSNHIVLDAKGKYIGSSSPYIYASGNNDLLYTLPTDFVIANLEKIIASIPKFNKLGINLCDWCFQNLIIGSTDGEDTNIYLIDDSFYELTNPFFNESEINNLIEDIVINHSFFMKNYNLLPKFLKDLKKTGDYFYYLEKESKGYDNLGTFFEERGKTYQKMRH